MPHCPRSATLAELSMDMYEKVAKDVAVCLVIELAAESIAGGRANGAEPLTGQTDRRGDETAL